MEEERETVIVTQPEGERFAVDHAGAVALHGAKEQPPLLHQFGGQVVHTGAPQQPLVHMVCWDEDNTCGVELSGRVQLAGDPEQPIAVQMRHEFANVHRQELRVEPLAHQLSVNTQLAQPIHHALQLRTPLELRFCNPWHLVSDYMLEINLGNNRVISVRLTGATVATPQPCDDKGCPPAQAQPDHP
jgi:hypothetical protein